MSSVWSASKGSLLNLSQMRPASVANLSGTSYRPSFPKWHHMTWRALLYWPSTKEASRAAAFVRAYDVGTAVARAAGLAALPASVDAAAATGHLLRAALEHAAVARPALPVEVVNAPFLMKMGKKEER